VLTPYVIDKTSEVLILKKGLTLKIGPFSVNIKCSEKTFAKTFCKIYAGFSFLQSSEYIDFHINISRPNHIRRFIRPYINFINDGKKPFKPLTAQEAFPFFEWGLNWCVATYAHHYFMLHSAVVEKNGNIIIFPAAPGSGKSTLSTCLMLSGWSLYSDEFALLDKDINTITPFGRPVSLKNESISLIENRFEVKVNSIVKGTSKGDVAHLMHKNINFIFEPVKLKKVWLVFPKYTKNAKTSLIPLSQTEAFMPLIDQSFNYNQLGSEGFKSAELLLNKCQRYAFEYSNIGEAIELFDNLITDE